MNDNELLSYYQDNLKPKITKDRSTLYAKLINISKAIGVKFHYPKLTNIDTF